MSFFNKVKNLKLEKEMHLIAAALIVCGPCIAFLHHIEHKQTLSSHNVGITVL